MKGEEGIVAGAAVVTVGGGRECGCERFGVLTRRDTDTRSRYFFATIGAAYIEDAFSERAYVEARE